MEKTIKTLYDKWTENQIIKVNATVSFKKDMFDAFMLDVKGYISKEVNNFINTFVQKCDERSFSYYSDTCGHDSEDEDTECEICHDKDVLLKFDDIRQIADELKSTLK